MESYIANGELYLLDIKKPKFGKLFAECCSIDADKIAGKIFKYISRYQETQIGFCKAIKMAKRYDVLDSDDFLNGLSQSNFNEFNILDENSLARLVRYAIKNKNNKMFCEILDFNKSDIILGCIFDKNITEWHKNKILK